MHFVSHSSGAEEKFKQGLNSPQTLGLLMKLNLNVHDIEGLFELLDVDARAAPDLYIVSSDENAFSQAMLEADRIRAEFPRLGVVQNLSGGSFKSQFKRADKSGATWVMVFGTEETVSGKVTLKPLRANKEQMTLSREELDTFLGQLEQLTSEY